MIHEHTCTHVCNMLTYVYISTHTYISVFTYIHTYIYMERKRWKQRYRDINKERGNVL